MGTRSAKRETRRVHLRVLPGMALIGALALLVSSSVPANAFFETEALAVLEADATLAAEIPLQQLSVAEEVIVASPVRDAYTSQSVAQQLRERYGDRTYSFTNNPNGSIQWPFATSVPIGSGFGERQVEGCSFCSTHHQGVDFTPGAGSIIQAIAAGVVSAVEFDRGGLGNHVVIDHVINGRNVQSIYGHMAPNSIRVAVGQTINVADAVGEVGNSGASNGAHLHLEIHLNKVAIDPFAWLKANAN